MDINQYIDIGVWVGIIAIAGRFSYALYSFLNGKRKADKDLKTILEQEIQALHRQDATQESRMNDLQNEIDDKNSKIRHLNEVLENRNPELDHILHTLDTKMDVLVSITSGNKNPYDMVPIRNEQNPLLTEKDLGQNDTIEHNN